MESSTRRDKNIGNTSKLRGYQSTRAFCIMYVMPSAVQMA